MTSKSTKPAWHISATDYGRQLTGMGVNLLVSHIETAVEFQSKILGATVQYWNEDFAVMSLGSNEWMLHADHTYSQNPYLGIIQGQEARGTGIELQLYQQNPDEIEARARQFEAAHVLSGCLNKPHGLRECYILDPDGYCWVISRPLNDDEINEIT